MPFLSHIDVHLWPCLDANQTKKLGFNFPKQHYWAFYIFNNKHLNLSCYFASISRNHKWIFNKQDIKSKRKLPISYLYVEIKWKPYECNTCSDNKLTRFNKGVFIIMNFNLMDVYINKNMVPI
jgi:hypothetical protein